MAKTKHKKQSHKGPGRPFIKLTPFQLEELEKLAAIHCTVEEMATIMGCSKDTLERNYAALIKKGKSAGRASLRRMQYQSAQKGSIPMLIWLGKQLLEQKDRTDHNFNFDDLSEDDMKDALVNFANQQKKDKA